MRVFFAIMTLGCLIGCEQESPGRTIIVTQRIADGLCMVEMASPHTLQLDCLQIGPGGSSAIVWTESFPPHPNGDNNQIWVRLGDEIHVYRNEGFDRKLPVQDLGVLNVYSRGFGSDSGAFDEPKIVWFAFFATDAEKTLPVVMTGLWTEEVLEKYAKDYALNMVVIKVSKEET